MKYSDIPQFTQVGRYKVDQSWKYLKNWIDDMTQDFNLQMNPEFQRGHVWTREQQIAYVEFAMRGGLTGRTVYFNCPDFHFPSKGKYHDCVCVDGLQRITAILAFMNNEIPAFGQYRNEYEEEEPMMASQYHIEINVNDLQTEEEVLKWYVEMNEGGTPHTKAEIQKVKDMIQRLSK